MPSNESVVIQGAREKEAADLHYSHAVRAGGLVFVSGVTGEQSDGSMPVGVAAQSVAAFDSVRATLAEANLGLENIVSITSYHVGDIQKDIWDFFAIKDTYIAAPYPAWTAVGVAELAHTGALVEVEVIAAER